MASLYAQSHVSLLLLGEKGSGKSSAGNCILCRPAFSLETSWSRKKQATTFGVQVTVVDTPGWLSHSASPHRVSPELVRGLALCHPGPDAILLVLSTSRVFGQKEWRAMEAQLTLLQTPIWQRAMVLFTHGDHLGGQPIQEHLRHQGGNAGWLLERCRNRYQVIDSKSSASQFQVWELLKKVQRMVEATRPPREIQYNMSIELGPDLSRSDNRRPTGPVMVETIQADGWSPGQKKKTELLRLRVPRGPAGLKSALSLILLGRRKSGKSSAGNMILGKEEFQTDARTTRCSAGQGEISGWPVTVVDTPGWSRFGLANPQKVKEELLQSPLFCPVKSKVVFVLLLPVDSFGEQDRAAMEMYLGVLGVQAWENMMVLFTYGEMLRGRPVESHIEKVGRPLQLVLDRCKRRHHVCDPNAADPTQVDLLLRKVEECFPSSLATRSHQS
ncbi:GTPase IMAP family member 8 [Nothobranchius furzeri]